MVKDLWRGPSAVQCSKDAERPKRYSWKHLDYSLLALLPFKFCISLKIIKPFPLSYGLMLCISNGLLKLG